MSASGPFFRQVLVCAKKSLIIHAAKQCTSKSEACWIHGQALKGLMEWYKARRILFPQRLSVCTSSNLCIATVHAQTKSTYTAVYRMLTPPDAPFHWSKFCQQRIHFRDEQGQLHFLMHCYHWLHLPPLSCPRTYDFSSRNASNDPAAPPGVRNGTISHLASNGKPFPSVFQFASQRLPLVSLKAIRGSVPIW